MTLRVELAAAQIDELEAQLAQDDPDLPTQRLRIIAYAAFGWSVQEISETVGLHPINVRKWIHRYERGGIDGLRSAKSPGRPVLFDAETRAKIVQLYQTDPRSLGLPFRAWSLARLKAYLMESGVVEHISIEAVRQYVKGIENA